METELKLRIAPAAVTRVSAHPLFRKADDESVESLEAVYYDTPDFELERKGASLRVRHEGGQWIQTVKWSGGARGGLHERNEIEAELSGPAPDCARITHPDLDPLFRAPQLVTALQPVFETRITRSKRTLTLDGATIEASLDQGEIRSGGRSEPVSELELELKRGSPPALFELALTLAAAAPLHLENRSKAERGYALSRGESPVPQKASAPALDAGMTVSEAFATIAWSTLAHLQANEDGALAGNDPEFLHQMRVALRRLRSAISAFSGVLPALSRERVSKELKWLGRALGPARDWDVFVTQTLPPIMEAYPDRPALDALAAEARRTRALAQRAMRRALRSRRYQKALIGVASWLASQGWRDHADAKTIAALDAPARVYAFDELEARYERVRRRGRKLEQLSAAELHKLRIAIKKLRYSTDFLASLFDAAKVRTLRSRLTRLQDALGTINDAATMQSLLAHGFGRSRSAAAAEARGILLGWSAGRGDALRGDLARAWRAFRRSETFW
jgi:inorganic triphosphatase YgiF